MSGPYALLSPRQRRLRGAAGFAIAILSVAAVVLGLIVWVVVDDGNTDVPDAGEKVALLSEPYGREVTVELPGSEVTVVVGDPVDRIGADVLDVDHSPLDGDAPDLVAPDGGSLVPVSWHTRAIGGFLRADDPEPIAIRLVAGDERVDLDSVVLGSPSASMDAFDAQSVAVGFDARVDPDDLAVEVEYDGLTQTAHVASGEVDAGAAQGLYEDTPSFTGGCTETEDQCPLRPTDPDSPLRPDDDTFTASYLNPYVYDPRLGWAPEGTRWIGVNLQLFGANALVNAAGDVWFPRRQSAPTVTLDGVEPVRREGLEAGSSSYGRVVFQIDADTDPQLLEIDHVLTGRAAGSTYHLTVGARLELTPLD